MIARWIIGVLFIVFAIVQLNDPDPWLWVMTYAYVGLLSIVSAYVRLPKPLVLASLLLLAGSVAYYIPLMMKWIDQGMPSIIGEMKASSPHIEWMREFLGLILCLGVLFWLNKSVGIELPHED